MTRTFAEQILTAAGRFVSTGLVVVVATVLLSWALSIASGDDSTESNGASSSLISESGIETIRVKLSVDAGRPYSFYSLEDENGVELLQVTYVRQGDLVVNLGKAFPIRPGFSARRNGKYEFAMIHNGVGHKINVRPDGQSGFVVEGRSLPIEQAPGEFGLGEVPRDPSTVDLP